MLKKGALAALGASIIFLTILIYVCNRIARKGKIAPDYEALNQVENGRTFLK